MGFLHSTRCVRGENIPDRQQVIDQDFADMDSRSGSIFPVLIVYTFGVIIGGLIVYALFAAGMLSC